eukprot:COSAG01_NODE_2599_length_7398_cov_3.522263_1_plen_90_part_00
MERKRHAVVHPANGPAPASAVRELTWCKTFAGRLRHQHPAASSQQPRTDAPCTTFVDSGSESSRRVLDLVLSRDDMARGNKNEASVLYS